MLEMDFTSEERQWIRREDLFRVKANIVQKWKLRLRQVQQRLADEAAQLPEPLYSGGYRISQGDHYRGLPYAVGDGPACFEKNDILAYRIICRWNGDTAFTLLLQGAYWRHFRNQILAGAARQPAIGMGPLYTAVGSTPWEHHFGVDNYRMWDQIPEEQRRSWQAASWAKWAFRQPPDVSYHQLESGAVHALRTFGSWLSGGFLSADGGS